MRIDRTHLIHLLGRGIAGVLLAVPLLGCSGKNPVDSALKDIMPPKPGEVAREAFNVYDADQRRKSVSLLSSAKFGGEAPYVRMYRLLVDDPDATVRAAAIKALGLHGTADDVKLIIPRLKDDAPTVRWESAQALQKLHSATAMLPLLDTLREDEDADTRMAAANALGQYAQPQVFQALVGALDDQEFGVVDAARGSLHTLTGYDFGNDGTLWVLWAQKNPDKLFVHQQPYTWQPFNKPRSIAQKMKFWKKAEKLPPRVPEGLDAAASKPNSAG